MTAAILGIEIECKAGKLIPQQFPAVKPKKASQRVRLNELGITWMQSSRWQRESQIKGRKKYYKRAEDAHEEITRAGLLRFANKDIVRPTPELPKGKYSVIYADPPWEYGDKLIEGYGAAEHHYPTMTIDELCALPILDIVANDAVLFLWVTSPLLGECWPIISAWGFEYKTTFVWDKVRHNYGHYNSVRHELLLVCTRGSYLPQNKKLYDSVQSIERSSRHSEKPEQFYQIIESMYPKGKKVELFARQKRKGWEFFGNEV